MKINGWLFLVFVLLMLIVLVVFYYPKTQFRATKVIVNNHEFNIEIADTESEREQGLMNQTHLDKNAGMLFIFPNKDIYTFWMKNTLIPLDIIWIRDNKIVEMTTLQTQKGDNIPQYTPKNKANYVLELNAGLISEYNFKIGDQVNIQ